MNTTKETTMETASKALMEGMKDGGVDEAANTLLAMAGVMVPRLDLDHMSETERSLVKATTAFAVLALCNAENSMIPHAPKVAEACVRVLRVASRDVTQPHMAKLRPFFMSLASIITPSE